MAQSKRRKNAKQKEIITLTARGEKRPAFRKSTCAVRGTVRRPDGSPFVGVLVRAYDQDLRKRQLLGKAITGDSGDYSIRYTTQEFINAEKGGADLLVCAEDEKGSELVASDVLFNAPAEAVIDLTLPAGLERRSEFEHPRERMHMKRTRKGKIV